MQAAGARFRHAYPSSRSSTRFWTRLMRPRLRVTGTRATGDQDTYCVSKLRPSISADMQFKRRAHAFIASIGFRLRSWMNSIGISLGVSTLSPNITRVRASSRSFLVLGEATTNRQCDRWGHPTLAIETNRKDGARGCGGRCGEGQLQEQLRIPSGPNSRRWRRSARRRCGRWGAAGHPGRCVPPASAGQRSDSPRTGR